MGHVSEKNLTGFHSRRALTVLLSVFRIKGGMFPEFFSSCSLRQLDEFMQRAQPNCLELPASGSSKSIALGPSCGNAILDPGEECDCGTAEVKGSRVHPKCYFLGC